MGKLRVSEGDEVWVLDTVAWKVARRNSTDGHDRSVIHTELVNAWNSGTGGYTVKLAPFSSNHLWFWVMWQGRKLRVHDSEVIRC